MIRAGHFHLSENMEEMFVCPHHRGNLGAYWKCPTSACQYPDHKGKQEAVKGDRVFNVQMAKDISKLLFQLDRVSSSFIISKSHKYSLALYPVKLNKLNGQGKDWNSVEIRD